MSDMRGESVHFSDFKRNRSGRHVCAPCRSLRSQRGVIIPLTAVMLVSLLSIGALSIDVGYLMVARNQIQNAADAAALSAAGKLYPVDASTKKPNWTAAEAEAASAIALNKVTNIAMSTGTVASGYWNITGSPAGLQSQSITAGNNDLPAVSVTLDKAANGGPIGTFFSKIFGMQTMNVRATAVAVVASPSKTKQGLFPFSLTKCMFDRYYLADGTISPDLENGIIQVDSAYHTYDLEDGSKCQSGQWTSFDKDSNSDNVIKQLINNYPAEDSEDSSIIVDSSKTWIATGTMANLYGAANDCSDQLYDSPFNPGQQLNDGQGNGKCAYVLLPVVCPPGTPECANMKDAVNGESTIEGFACVHILCANQGASGKGCSDICVEPDPKNPKKCSKSVDILPKAAKDAMAIQMVPMTEANNHPGCRISGTGGGAPNYGVILPPKLANYSGNTY
jgi:Flp pilus assembly protein TadG